MLSRVKNKRKLKRNSVLIENIQITPFNEVLLDNIIEEDVQSVLRPLNLMQAVFLCSKYTIRDKFVTFNRSAYNAIGVIAMLIFRMLCLSNFISSSSSWKDVILVKWGRFFNILFFSFGFMLNYYFNIKQSHKNISLVLRIQHVHRILKMYGKGLKSLIIYNWVCVVVVNGFWLIYIILSYYCISEYYHLSIYEYITAYTLITFDVNVLYAILVLKLLNELLIAFIENVLSSKNIEDAEGESNWKITYEVYVNLFEACKLVEDTFQHFIVYYTIYTVFQSLLAVAVILKLELWDGDLKVILFVNFSQTLWLLKSIIMEIFLSMECEKYYSAMKDVYFNCVLLKSKRCSDTQRRMYKNIQRIHNTSFKKMDACGLFIIDAMLPLQLFSLITSYIIVQLQFKFL